MPEYVGSIWVAVAGGCMRERYYNKPTVEEIRKEIKRVKFKENYAKTFKSMVYVLVTVAAAAMLAATMAFPVLQIYGSSMTPTLTDGEIIVAVKGTELEKGDIIAFYYNNKVLVKRVIASSGEWVDIDEEGNVLVNGVLIEEPYITEKSFGECDIKLPYQVPEGKIFVMGDHRKVSVDSRNTAVGCISEELIVGKLLYRVWPVESVGKIN